MADVELGNKIFPGEPRKCIGSHYFGLFLRKSGCSVLREQESTGTRAVPSCCSGPRPAGPSSAPGLWGTAGPHQQQQQQVPAGPRGIPWAWCRFPEKG